MTPYTNILARTVSPVSRDDLTIKIAGSAGSGSPLGLAALAIAFLALLLLLRILQQRVHLVVRRRMRQASGAGSEREGIMVIPE